jgi:hypothetical protein
MKPGLVKIIEKVHHIWGIFETSETDLYTAVNACSIDYANTWSLKQVHRLSKIQSPHSCSTYFECENMVEFDTRVTWATLPIMRIHPREAQECNIWQIPATLHNTRSLDHCPGCHGSPKAILILDPVDIEKAYHSSVSCYHCLQWHVRSFGWRYASFGEDDDSREQWLILRRGVCTM